MKKYGEYTSIGLPWYPNGAPSHWKILRHKNVLTQHKELVGENSDKYTLLSLTLNGVIIRNLSEGKGKFSKDYDKYVVVNEGDFVFCLFDIDETPRTVGLSKHYGMITGAYDVFTPHDINSDYFFYYYLALDNNKLLKPLYTGLRKVIAYPTFTTIKFPVPPRSEQDQIVRYLDWKTSRINKLIKGYKRQIELLEEGKKSKITYMVTHDRFSDKRKKSEIYWLESIPYSWCVTRLKHILIKQDRPIPENAELLICSNSGEVKPRGDNKLGLVANNNDIYQGVSKNDLLIHGMDTWHGAIAISDYDGMCTPVVHVCTSSQSIRFIRYYLRMMSFSKVFKAISNGVRQNTSDFRSWDKVGGLYIALPSFEEQETIADILDEYVSKTNIAIAGLEKEIQLLKEYRTRLISDVVTGQIDVRDIQIPEYIPEEETEMTDMEVEKDAD